MYFRFNNFISKIEHTNTSKKGQTYVKFKQPNGMIASCNSNLIAKASFNLINLIEVGDYVNGSRVYEIKWLGDKPICVMVGYKGFVTGFYDDEGYLYQTIYDEDIKSIVTKDQFSQMEYKVN